MPVKPKIWICINNAPKPAGGVNHAYRLCGVADSLGIEAHVLNPVKYEFVDPSGLGKYWTYAKDSFNGISEGDIVLYPELWRNKIDFGVPIRRVMLVQNWALAHDRQPHEKLFWTYNSIHLNYAQQRVGGLPPVYPNHEPSETVQIEHTVDLINTNRPEWFIVSPYFDSVLFNDVSQVRDRNKAMVMMRKSQEVAKPIISRVNCDTIEGIHPSKMHEMYKKYGAFILTTPAESLSFPAAESLLSGTPVISWPSGGPEEFLINDETAIMVKFNDREALVAAANDLLCDHTKQAKLGTNGRDLVKKLYNIERTRLELYIAYNAVCRHNPEL